jgi:hypothetical protein
MISKKHKRALLKASAMVEDERIALRILQAIGRIDEVSNVVSGPEEDDIQVDRDQKDLTDLIKESADILVTVMESKNASKDFRDKCREAYDRVNNLQRFFNDLGKEMMKSIGADEDDKDLAASKIGLINDALKAKTKELGTFLKATELLKSLEKKAKPIPKPMSAPVQHKPTPKEVKDKPKGEATKTQAPKSNPQPTQKSDKGSLG